MLGVFLSALCVKNGIIAEAAEEAQRRPRRLLRIYGFRTADRHEKFARDLAIEACRHKIELLSNLSESHILEEENYDGKK